jgi:peptide/nickel transport system substrate-binding protein
LRVALPGAVDSLHPFFAQTSAAQTVLGAVFVGCIGAGAADVNTPQPLGCEQVPTLEDGGAQFIGEGLDRYLAVTFKIRPGWRWSDGRAVTAQDAVFAWQLLMQPALGVRDPLTQKVYAMSAPDARTIVVQFMSAAQARAAATGNLSGDVAFEYFAQLGDYAQYAQQETPLVDEHYWAVVRWLPAHLLQGIAPKDQATSNFARQPVGDGAYEVRSNTGDTVTLVRSPQPFPLHPLGGSAGKEPIDEIHFVSAPGGGVDVGLPESGAAENQTAALVFDANTAEQVLLNVNRFPFDDVRVRQALAHAIDRAALAQELRLAGFAPLAPSPALGYAPERTQALLIEAGWQCATKPCQRFDATKGVTQTLEFTLVTTERTPRNLVAQAIQKQLSAVGFGVNIQIVYGAGQQSKLFAPFSAGGILLTRNFDAALYQALDWEAGNLAGRFGCASIPSAKAPGRSQGNAAGFCDAEVDKLIGATLASEGVISSVAQAQARVAAATAIETAAPLVRLYKPRLYLLAKGVAGLKPSANMPITWNAWEWVRAD